MAEIQTPGGLFDGDGAFPDSSNSSSNTDIDKQTVYEFLVEILQEGSFIDLTALNEPQTITISNTRTDADINTLADQRIEAEVNLAFIQQFFASSASVTVTQTPGGTQLEFTAQAPLQQPVQLNTLTSGNQMIANDGTIEVVVTPPVGDITNVDTVIVTGPDGTTVPNDMVTTTVNDDGTATVAVDTQDNPGDYNVDVTTTVVNSEGEMLDTQQTTVTATAMIYHDVLSAQPTSLSQITNANAFNGQANITFNGGQMGSAYIAVQTGKTYTFKTGIFFADSEIVTTVEGYDVYRINDFADIDPGAANTLTIEVVEV